MAIRSRALLASFLITAPAISQTPPSGAPVGMTLQQFEDAGRGRLLDRDADGDGKISKAEFSAPGPNRRGKAAQANTGDAAGNAAGGAMAGGMGDRMFQRFDANGDGYLDKSEIDAMLAQRFQRMDANHDGILTAEERQAARGAMRGRASPEQ